MFKPSRKEIRKAKTSFLQLLTAQAKLDPASITFVYDRPPAGRYAILYMLDCTIVVNGKYYRVYATRVWLVLGLAFLVGAGSSKEDAMGAVEAYRDRGTLFERPDHTWHGKVLSFGYLESRKIRKLLEELRAGGGICGDEELKKWFSLE